MPAQPQYTIPAGQAVKATLFLSDPVLTLDGGQSGFRPAVTTDFVPAFSAVSSTAVTGSMGAPTTGVALAANTNRKVLHAQVVGSGGPVYLNYANAVPSAAGFAYALAAATTDGGMDGGTLTDLNYKGIVVASGFTAARWVIWEGV